MTIKERIELGKLGYTKEEIRAMDEEAKTVAVDPVENPVENVDNSDEQSGNKPSSIVAGLMESIEALNQKLNNEIKFRQDQMLKETTQPAQRSAEELLGDFLTGGK